MSDKLSRDQRITQFIEAARRLKQGDYDLKVPIQPADDLGRLGKALQELAQSLETRYREIQELDRITSHINAGLLLDDILDIVYRDFREVIPYNRIGFSLLNDESQAIRVKARWAKSDQPVMKIVRGYSAALAGSSLETIIQTRQPRIINDLVAYLENKPQSESTRLVVAEGMRSSLTCPLVANGVPIGFMFFSSIEPNTYADVHVETFKRIANQFSVIVEKGRLVSELAAQKAAIEEQNETLRHLNEVKNSFLGIAAHDLRGPISYIQMSADLLQDSGESLAESELTKMLNSIGHQTRHMLTLLDELLDVTQIEAGKLELALEPVSLGQFLIETVSHHRIMAAQKGTEVELLSVPGGEVMADPVRLRQVVDNLISNAVKYSPPGSAVTVSVKRNSANWRVTVTDEGPGITLADRKRLFKDFARLSAQPTGGEKSFGLGLAISRRVVEAHGGRIGVDSEPGHGANFWFTVPNRL